YAVRAAVNSVGGTDAPAQPMAKNGTRRRSFDFMASLSLSCGFDDRLGVVRSALHHVLATELERELRIDVRTREQVSRFVVLALAHQDDGAIDLRLRAAH